MLGGIRRGSVLVADRLYPSFQTIATLNRAGVDMVSISHATRTIDFRTGYRLGPKDHIVDWEKGRYIHGLDNETFRALPATVRVREFALEIEGRDGKPEEVIVVTTMTDPTIPQKEIADLYFERWNCELDLRSIKCSMQMDILRGKTPSMVRKEIFAHLLAYNLLRGTMVECAKRNAVTPRQLSVKGAMQAIESFTPAMMAIDGSDTLYNAMMATVSAHRVGNRPGRLEPRFKKRRPKWMAYMTIPRHKSRRRLASEVRPLT
jgi:hypothetical protein